MLKRVLLAREHLFCHVYIISRRVCWSRVLSNVRHVNTCLSRVHHLGHVGHLLGKECCILEVACKIVRINVREKSGLFSTTHHPSNQLLSFNLWSIWPLPFTSAPRLICEWVSVKLLLVLLLSLLLLLQGQPREVLQASRERVSENHRFVDQQLVSLLLRNNVLSREHFFVDFLLSRQIWLFDGGSSLVWRGWSWGLVTDRRLNLTDKKTEGSCARPATSSGSGGLSGVIICLLTVSFFISTFSLGSLALSTSFSWTSALPSSGSHILVNSCRSESSNY